MIRRTRGPILIAAVIGTLLSFAAIAGFAINSAGVFTWLQGSPIVTLLAWLVGSVACFGVVMLLWRAFEKVANSADDNEAYPNLSFGKLMLVLAVGWCPYVVLGLPGSNCVDYFSEVAQWLGAMPFTAHHPPFMTMLFGVLWQIGSFVGGSMGGQILTLLFQCATFAMCIAASIRLVAELRVKRATLYGATAFFALCPVVPLYAQWCIKNTIAAGVLLLMLTQVLLRVLRVELRTAFAKRLTEPMAMAATGALCCLSRNDGMYVVLPTLFVCFLCALHEKAERKVYLTCGVAIALIQVAWTMVAIPALGVGSGSAREMLSIPLQQIARCAGEHPDFYANERGERLEGLLREGQSVSTVAEGFRTYESDYVKAQFVFDSSGDIVDLLGIWGETVRSYPVECAQTFLITTVGYWSPFMSADWYFGMGSEYLTFIDSVKLTDEKGDVHPFAAEGLHEVLPDVRELIRKIVRDVTRLPVIGWFANPATYVWGTLLFCGYLIVRNRRTLPICVAMGLLFAICIASPVNGEMRYALPMMLFSPILCAACCSKELG